jgi:hypothetical protein
MTYNNFLLEIGLYRCPLAWSYVEYGHLAIEATWFQNLWNLVDTFKVDLSFRKENLVHGIQENDQALMSEFYQVGYHGKDLAALNIICRFRNLLHLSNISKCDGISFDEFLVLDFTKLSTLYVFPWEKPTPLELCLWKDAIHRLCSGTLMLPFSLGRFMHHPHLPCSWYTDKDASVLFWILDDSAVSLYDIYHSQLGAGTWHRVRYDWVSLESSTHLGTHFASVTMCDATVAIVHSTAPFSVSVPSPTC